MDELLLERMHRATAMVFTDAMVKEYGEGTQENYLVTPPRLTPTMHGVLMFGVQAMLSLQRWEPWGRGPYFGDYFDRTSILEGVEDQAYRREVLEALRIGGVRYKIARIRVCPHLSANPPSDHLVWLKREEA